MADERRGICDIRPATCCMSITACLLSWDLFQFVNMVVLWVRHLQLMQLKLAFTSSLAKDSDCGYMQYLISPSICTLQRQVLTARIKRILSISPYKELNSLFAKKKKWAMKPLCKVLDMNHSQAKGC